MSILKYDMKCLKTLAISGKFCLGDGIEDCIVTRDNRIITSYFDEGVFADAPSGGAAHGSKSLVVWNSSRQRIF